MLHLGQNIIYITAVLGTPSKEEGSIVLSTMQVS